MAEHDKPLLQLDSVCAGYGPTLILDNISITIPRGEAVSVLGRNGVGKTTLLSTIMGHTTLHRGTITMHGEDISREPPYRRSWRGLGLVPQTRRIFPSLTVAENLEVARRPGRWTSEAVYQLFPSLGERRGSMGNHLSGGEQQMLAVGRALIGNPSLILMDEPFEGLAPVIVDELSQVFGRLRAAGEPAIVLVEQHTRLALELTSRTVVLDRGRVVYDGDSQSLIQAPSRLDSLIGVAAADDVGEAGKSFDWARQPPQTTEKGDLSGGTLPHGNRRPFPATRDML